MSATGDLYRKQKEQDMDEAGSFKPLNRRAEHDTRRLQWFIGSLAAICAIVEIVYQVAHKLIH